MIRLLEEKDRGWLMAYLVREPAINLFMIGDVELFGFDKDFQRIWADFDDEGAIKAVLLRYRDNFIPYSELAAYDWTALAAVIDGWFGEKRVSGKLTTIDAIAQLLKGYTRKDYYFCELRGGLKGRYVDNIEVKLGCADDAARFHEFIEGIDEFSGFGNRVERYSEKINSGSGRIYYMENDQGELMTMTQTTAENSVSAMVVGVATAKAYRGQGLMSACLTKLCEDALEEGKSLCLFYNNPAAGKVYLKMGFKEIDHWSMLTFKV